MDGMLVATRKPPTDAIVCSGVLDSQVGGKVLVQRILEESVLVNRKLREEQKIMLVYLTNKNFFLLVNFNISKRFCCIYVISWGLWFVLINAPDRISKAKNSESSRDVEICSKIENFTFFKDPQEMC